MPSLVPNAGSVALKSAAVWVGFAIAAITLTVNGVASDNAPDWVKADLPVAAIKQTWDWFVPYITALGVLFARVIQQDSISGGAP